LARAASWARTSTFKVPQRGSLWEDESEMMKRVLAVGLCAVAIGCSTPSTATSPAPIPQISGTYVFSIFPATSCTGFTFASFAWTVTAAFQNNSGVYVVHITIPAPHPSLAVTLTYNVDVLNPAIAQGSLSTPIPLLPNTPGVPISGTDLKFNTNAPLTGTVTTGTDGRGIINSGTLVGDLEVLDQSNTIVQSCNASNHVWTLTEH
jgi:hypothetical protein